MFKFISNHLKKRKKETKRKNYINGYNFAVGALLREEETPLFIESYYYDTQIDQFDFGMIDAVIKLEKIGFITDKNILL